MPYEKFDPRGRKGPEVSLIEERRENRLTTYLQIALIVMGVRVVMLITGVAFIYIPVLDPLLVRIVRLFM